MSSDLTNKILRIINDKKPQSVKELSDMLKLQNDLTEDKIMEVILKLQAEGSIKLKNKNFKNNFKSYLISTKAIWYWVTIVIGVSSVLLFFSISESTYPVIYLRNITGLLLVLFLPGYVLTRILFPINMITKIQHKQIQPIQRVALSIGMSSVLVTIIGLLVYYSPWGLDLLVVILSLFVLILVLATAALVNEYRIKK